MALGVELRDVRQAIGTEVIARRAVTVGIELAHRFQQQVRAVGDQAADLLRHQLEHRRLVIDRVRHHREAGGTKQRDVVNVAGSGAEIGRRIAAAGIAGVRIGTGELQFREVRREHRRQRAAVGEGVGAHRVHDAQRGGFFLIRVLRCADLAARVVDIRQRDRRFEHAAAGIGMQQERAELVAEPQRAVRCALHRLDVEVGTGQHPCFGKVVDDRERNPAVRIAQLDMAQHVDAAGTAARGFQVGAHRVDAQIEVGRVLQAAVTVVGHHREAAVGVAQHRRKALHRLAIDERWCDAIDRRAAEVLAGRRSGGEGLCRQDGASLQRGGSVCAAAGPGRCHCCERDDGPDVLFHAELLQCTRERASLPPQMSRPWRLDNTAVNPQRCPRACSCCPIRRHAGSQTVATAGPLAYRRASKPGVPAAGIEPGSGLRANPWNLAAAPDNPVGRAV